MALTKAQERGFWKKRIAELEKENAELRLKLKALDEQTPWKDIKDKSELIKENTKLKEESKKIFNDWLNACDKYGKVNLKFTKAKDILRRLMENQPTPSSMYEEADLVGWREVNKEAEQFLQENE